MSETLSFTDDVSVLQDAAVRNMMDAMRIHVGQGRAWLYADLAAASRLSERSLRSYAAGRALPNYGALATLTQILGADFANRLWSGTGLAFYETPEVCSCPPADMALELAECALELQRAVASGYSHVHRAGLAKSIGPKLARIGGAIMNGAGK